MRTHHPTGAKHQVAARRVLHRALAGPLALAVDRQRGGRIGLGIGSGGSPIKHIVGGVMHQHRAMRCSPLGQHRRGLGIDGMRHIGFLLGFVHRGIGRGIDDELGLVLIEQGLERRCLGQISLRPGTGHDRAHHRQGLRQRMPQLTLRAQQQNAQGGGLSHSAGPPTGGKHHS